MIQKTPSVWFAAVCATVVWAAGCDDQSNTVPTQPPPVAQSPSPDLLPDQVGRLQALLEAAAIGDGEVILVLKDPSEPAAPPDARTPSGLYKSGTMARRNGAGFAKASPASRAEVRSWLAAREVQPNYEANVLPVMTMELPAKGREAFLTALINHPNVDYVTANRSIDAKTAAGPGGSNPTSLQHSFHNVGAAWNYTYGANIRLGVLDSGIIDPHEDAGLIIARGFVDDYGSCNQAAGACVSTDDNGHGTRMAGVVGMTDNNVGYVGVAPATWTYSLKVAMNCGTSGSCSPASDEFEIEEDDLVAAIDWAIANGLDILTMSWISGDIGGTARSSLYTAYSSHSMMLLAATGNLSSDCNKEPANLAYVYGVGAVNTDGSNYGCQTGEDFSGLGQSVRTIHASCSAFTLWCSPGPWPGTYTFTCCTSAATQVVGAIAALVMANHPSWYPYQVRNRLYSTATGPNKIVDAGAATAP